MNLKAEIAVMSKGSGEASQEIVANAAVQLVSLMPSEACKYLIRPRPSLAPSAEQTSMYVAPTESAISSQKIRNPPPVGIKE